MRVCRRPTHFLLSLQALDDGHELAEGFLGLLVVLDLGGDKLGQMTQGLGGVQNLDSGQQREGSATWGL